MDSLSASFSRFCRLIVPVFLCIIMIPSIFLALDSTPCLILDTSGLKENHFKTHGEYLAIYDEYKLGLSSYDAIDKQAGTAKHYGYTFMPGISLQDNLKNPSSTVTFEDVKFPSEINQSFDNLQNHFGFSRVALCVCSLLTGFACFAGIILALISNWEGIHKYLDLFQKGETVERLWVLLRACTIIIALLLLISAILTEAALVTEMYMINEYGPPHGISGHRKYTFSITIWAISAFAAVTAGLAWRAEKHLPVHWNVNRANAITGVPPPANPRVPAQNAGAGLQVIQEEQEEEGIEMEDMAPAGQEDGDAELQDVPPRLEEDGAFEMVDMAPARREDGDVGLRHMPPVVHEDENPEGQDLSSHPAPVARDPSPEVEGAAGNRNLRARIRRASTIFTRSSGESDLENAVSARDGV